MAQRIVSWLICDGRFRVHAINGIGCRKGRIIEIEEVETGERTHGSSRLMQWLVSRLLAMGKTPERMATPVHEIA